MSTYKDNLKPGQEIQVHVKLHRNEYDPETGKPMQEPRIQIFTVAEFKNFEKQASRLGYRIEMLHDPRDKAPDVEKELEGIELEKARKEYEQVFGKKAHNQKNADSLRKEIAEHVEYENIVAAWQKAMKVKATPHISKEEMMEDIRRINLKMDTVQQEHDLGKEKKIQEDKDTATASAKRQAQKPPAEGEGPENAETE